MRLPRKLRWAILAVLAVLALIGSAGLAIANPSSNDHEAACAVWDTPGTAAYQLCLDNLNAQQDQSGLIPGSQPGTPTISATNSGNDHNPPFYFCLDSSKSQLASTKPIKDCNRALVLVCLWQQADGKYHCVDDTGKPADPPNGICKTNPHFACAAEAAATTKATDDPSTSPAQPPSSAAPRNVTFPPSTLDPAGQALSDPSITGDAVPTPNDTSTATATQTATPSPSPTHDTDDLINQTLAQAQAQNLRIWLDTDLVNAWKKGPERLKEAAEHLKTYASQPGVIGTKIAFDLALRGEFTDPAEVVRFVTETSQVLRPAGRRIALDVAIPELGCGSNQACVAKMRDDHPLITLANVEKYVLNGAIDAVNISVGIPAKQYTDHYKIQPSTVINNMWSTLRRQGWKNKLPGLYVGARETGLAHSGAASTLTAAQAKALVKDRVDVPLQGGNEQDRSTSRLLPATADHVVLWTWRQTFDGQTWRLTDADGRPNSVWNTLRTRQSLRALSIPYNPREPEVNIADDVKTIATVASAIFVFVTVGDS